VSALNGATLREPAREAAQRQALYEMHLQRAWEDRQSSSDSFDKSLLTVSSGALGVSLVFIKDIVPLPHAVWMPLLYSSWGFLAACVVLTVFSFRLSVAALDRHIDHLDEYYRKEVTNALNRKSIHSKMLTLFTWSAASFFLAGVACTIVFCVKNVEESKLSDTKKVVRVQEGRAPVSMTPVSNQAAPEQAVIPRKDIVEKGRKPVSMTAVPPPAKTPGNAPNTSGSGTPADQTP